MIKYSIDPIIQMRKITEIVKITEIIRVNKFDDEAVKNFTNDVTKAMNTGQTVLPIIVDSPGGHVYGLMAMLDIIKTVDIPVATIITGRAMSAGAVLFSAGTEGMRFMSKNSTIMIHEVSSGEVGKVEDLKVNTDEALRLNKILMRTLSNNCGKTDDFFQKLIHEKNHADWFLDADEAKKLNLANHIRIPSFKIDIKVTNSFE
jgi:ATP-dependent Clp protease protease subunit